MDNSGTLTSSGVRVIIRGDGWHMCSLAAYAPAVGGSPSLVLRALAACRMPSGAAVVSAPTQAEGASPASRALRETPARVSSASSNAMRDVKRA
eukprot:scaffold253111_cov20-Tisochrysis_lutea.AAC.4